MRVPIRAILVSVNYSDLLSVCLPYSRHHFSEVWIVTSPADAPNVCPIAEASGARVVVTDLFYARGADFNKFCALEHGLDVMGRHGWICHLDADVCWPRNASDLIRSMDLKNGHLYGCVRRMMENPRDILALKDRGVPSEDKWAGLPIHRNIGEWAGFTQMYHADDCHLGPAPWHDVTWRHAGGGDSFFQQKWPGEYKVRLPFEVLHIGSAGQNWFGRATALIDGSPSPLPDAAERARKNRDLWMERRRTGFTKEKLDS